MSEMIEKMLQHSSVRDFVDEALPDETKLTLLRAAKSASSSNFVQAYSIIEITDKKLRAQLAPITNSASYVEQTGTFYVFVADLYRQATLLRQQGKAVAALQNMESLFVAVIDTALAAQNMAIAAESMDLGICFIGGIRNDAARVADLLNLPEFTLPLFGLTVGKPRVRNEVKPRLALENQVAQNSYNRVAFTDLAAYDAHLAQYYQTRSSHHRSANWSSQNLAFFAEPRRPELTEFLKKQGFLLK